MALDKDHCRRCGKRDDEMGVRPVLYVEDYGGPHYRSVDAYLCDRCSEWMYDHIVPLFYSQEER